MTNQTRITIHDIALSIGAPVDQITKVILGQPGVSAEFRRKVYTALEEAGLVRVSQETTEGTIGVVITGTLSGEYNSDLVRGITETAKKRGYSLMLYSERSSREDDLIRMFGPGGCDGIIVIVPNQYQRLLELCRQYGRDHVLIDYQGDDDMTDVLTVEVHNYQAILQVMSHLLELGHRRIAFITGLIRVASAQQRLQGYLDALDTAGIAYDPALVAEGDWFHERAFELTQQLLDLDDPPTAIVASNDLMAFGAMQAARHRGLEIGGDISITGFDDIDMASTVTPSLTTVRQPIARLGEVAVDMLVKRHQGQEIAQPHAQLDTELIIRQSTGRAPR